MEVIMTRRERLTEEFRKYATLELAMPALPGVVFGVVAGGAAALGGIGLAATPAVIAPFAMIALCTTPVVFGLSHVGHREATFGEHLTRFGVFLATTAASAFLAGMVVAGAGAVALPVAKVLIDGAAGAIAGGAGIKAAGLPLLAKPVQVARTLIHPANGF